MDRVFDNGTAVQNNLSASATDELKILHVVSLCLMCVVCVLGVFGNGLVIYILGYKLKTTMNTIWFLNMAIADFLFTLFLIFVIVNIALDFQWPFGHFMCKLFTLVAVLNMFASIFLLTAISLDRCVSTHAVMWAKRNRSKGKARVICLFIWLTSLTCSLPYSFFRDARFNTSAEPIFCKYTFPDEHFTNKALVLFRFVAGFAIPFFIITCSYMAIAGQITRLKRVNNAKPFRLILTMISAFFLCWLPFHIQQFLELQVREAVDKGQTVSFIMRTFALAGPLTTSLAYVNSCLNPILYAFICKDFKRSMQSTMLAFEKMFSEENNVPVMLLRTYRSTNSTRSNKDMALQKRNVQGV